LISWQLAVLELWLRGIEKRRLARARSVPAARARMERMAARFAPRDGVPFAAGRLGRLAALQRAAPEGGGVILWLHGGAFCLGSPRTHMRLVAGLAAASGTGAVIPRYRLAPEHPFPAAVEDARAAWDALLAEGVPPGRIVVGGDSAGGGLAFALLHGILAGGRAGPAGVVAFSPWTDLPSRAGASPRSPGATPSCRRRGWPRCATSTSPAPTRSTRARRRTAGASRARRRC
jgi:acetyl esterase/lipase